MSSIASKHTKILHPGSVKTSKRIKRGLPTSSAQKRLKKIRLRVHKTSQHMRAMLISPEGRILASASTLEKAFRGKHGGNVKAAEWVGTQLAGRAQKGDVKTVVFDRAGYPFQGRVKALADAARAAGLVF